MMSSGSQFHTYCMLWHPTNNKGSNYHIVKGDRLVIISGPSGVGKGTLVTRVLEAHPGKKWCLLGNNESYSVNSGALPSLLGEMVAHESGREVFKSRMLVIISPLTRSWNLMMKTAEEHANLLQLNPDLGKLYWVME